MRSRFLLHLAGLLLLPVALAGQGAFRPIIAAGPELLETSSPIPGTPASRTEGLAPGMSFEFGLGYLPPGKAWGAELRGLHLSRSQHAVNGCLNAGPDDCTLETQTRVSGVSLAARYSPRATRRLQPYLRSGLGVYRVYHSEPTAFIPNRGGGVVLRDTRTTTSAAFLAGGGVQLGQGRPQLFLETTLLQYLGSAPRERSLLVALGFRI